MLKSLSDLGAGVVSLLLLCLFFAVDVVSNGKVDRYSVVGTITVDRYSVVGTITSMSIQKMIMIQ